MKLHTIAGDPVVELSQADLDNERTLARVANGAAVGDRIYAPPCDQPPRPLEKRATFAPDAHSFFAEPRPVVMHSSKPDPRRVDRLRAALRRRGLELEDERAYFWKVIER